MNSFTARFKNRPCHRFYTHVEGFFTANMKLQHNSILVALSGGRDSIAAFLFAFRFCQKNSLGLRAIHIHHGQRTESDAELAYVQELCELFEVELIVERFHSKLTTNIEANLRKFRYEMFAKHLVSNELCMLGHHLDDSFEWSMLRQFKSGEMPLGIPFRNGRFIRPLLCVSRAQVTAFMKNMGLSWCDDVSNLDHRFERNFIRFEVRKFAKRFPNYLDKYVAQQKHLLHLMNLQNHKLEKCFSIQNTQVVIQTQGLSKEDVRVCLSRSIRALLPSKRSSMGKELDKYSKLIMSSKRLEVTMGRKLKLSYRRPNLIISVI